MSSHLAALADWDDSEYTDPACGGRREGEEARTQSLLANEPARGGRYHPSLTVYQTCESTLYGPTTTSQALLLRDQTRLWSHSGDSHSPALGDARICPGQQPLEPVPTAAIGPLPPLAGTDGAPQHKLQELLQFNMCYCWPSMLVADEPRRRRRHVEVARQPDHWQLLGRHRRLRASKRRRRRRLMAPPSSAIDAGRLRPFQWRGRRWAWRPLATWGQCWWAGHYSAGGFDSGWQHGVARLCRRGDFS